MEIDDDPEIRAGREAWLAGGSALPVVELLRARGARIQAATYARLALARPDCIDAGPLRDLLATLSSPPSGWDAALEAFAQAPSPEAWRALQQFIPADMIYLRLRETVSRLRAAGVAGDVIFHYAGESGLVPELIELVEDGKVSPGFLEQRAARAGGAKATYFGLAAQAALLSGDLLGTARLLRLSLANENDMVGVFPHLEFIRSRATPEQIRMLGKAGIPLDG